SVMATIWRADEHPVYRISVLFHKNIAAGMRKDDALRVAKIDYLKTANKERSLPYYWSNMVIMGNTDPIELIHQNYLPWFIAVAILFGLIIVLNIWRKTGGKSEY
ncbi:MAG: CHAT domain-containing protein, partial [Chitinophagaceae bacterium]|nr:CHAT domain-containing protein [Chitinophagaceae bacterium]